MRETIRTFFESWKNGGGMKELCANLHEHMQGNPQAAIAFEARPGISYSIRMNTGETIAALLDVIDDDPEDRWISLCFPDALISDPDERGDVVPGGLFGNDARCFSIDALESDTEEYMKRRLDEAARGARSQA